MAAPIAIHLEFGGGAELLFGSVKEHHVTLPNQSAPWDMKQLLVWIRGNMLKERPELFVQGDTVVKQLQKERCRQMFIFVQKGTATIKGDWILPDRQELWFVDALSSSPIIGFYCSFFIGVYL
ncbi:ubiquitin-related modifier 1 isoform X1 [Salvelinus namaycush]|uniref:Ubiquitin-related modifier 1 n=1 Tax=Salvelinus namaycush TaxID=8040 RepID=A0A8U0TS22_SALNM|nr:ubiquitin-related modifier 1 isoform X1 [Salvelinus namaycush]